MRAASASWVQGERGQELAERPPMQGSSSADASTRWASPLTNEMRLRLSIDEEGGRARVQQLRTPAGLLRALEQPVPAHQRVDARPQLGIGVRLDQVVVRARLQTLDDLSVCVCIVSSRMASCGAPGPPERRNRQTSIPETPGMTQSSTSTSGARVAARCSSIAEPSANTSTA